MNCSPMLCSFRTVGLLALVLIAVGCGGPKRPAAKLYAGPVQPAQQLASVEESAGVRMVAFNNQLLWNEDKLRRGETGFQLVYAPIKGQTYSIEPGDQRMVVLWQDVSFESHASYTIKRWSATRGNFSLRHAFEAGKKYKFGTFDFDGPRGSVTIPVLLEEGEDRPVAYPEIFAEPIEGINSATGTTVYGIGTVKWDDAYHNVAGRQIALLTDIDGFRRWYERKTDDGKQQGSFASEPPGWDDAPKTVGYGVGQFDFKDVPPGKYIVAFFAPTDPESKSRRWGFREIVLRQGNKRAKVQIGEIPFPEPSEQPDYGVDPDGPV
ncbi:MAG: hypothetical protein AAF743_06455 [Planctomycetota bacterium]